NIWIKSFRKRKSCPRTFIFSNFYFPLLCPKRGALSLISVISTSTEEKLHFILYQDVKAHQTLHTLSTELLPVYPACCDQAATSRVQSKKLRP
ncbi:unnamed protein product, partial [Gulo gulo]